MTPETLIPSKGVGCKNAPLVGLRILAKQWSLDVKRMRIIMADNGTE